MLDVSKIIKFLDDGKSEVISDVRIRPSDEAILIYVRREKVAEKVKVGFTSLRQLNNIKKKLATEFSRNIEVILVQSDSQDELEAGFYRILNRRFSDSITSLYISFRDESTVDSWLEVAGLNNELKNEIEQHYIGLLNEADLIAGKTNWLGTLANLPTLPALLRLIKVYQPIRADELLSICVSNFGAIDDKWINNKLDQLRKKGFLVRQKSSETYVLTEKALHAVPAGTQHTSSDIQRVLALGRRKW